MYTGEPLVTIIQAALPTIKEGFSMMFTEETDQGYERLTRQTPYKRRGSGSGRRTVRYSLADLDCRGCLEEEDCRGESLCPYTHCNLPALALDQEFLLAVNTGESCKTLHKETFLYLQRNGNGCTLRL